MTMGHLVKVTDSDHALSGLIVSGHRCYYDIHHTGNSPDLFMIEHNGAKYKALSTQVDVEHYDAQLQAEVVAKLGANVGDTVVINGSGSGSFSAGWKTTGHHVITKIDPSGNVEFDGGCRNAGASMFRPIVRAL